MAVARKNRHEGIIHVDSRLAVAAFRFGFKKYYANNLADKILPSRNSEETEI